ncbi:hypothetical protein AGMMS50229_20290 [Campylobacterota bacterium]|nr:hypothetical protein AGMMS50229_20290 [Campylobacterota bacterium]
MAVGANGALHGKIWSVQRAGVEESAGKTDSPKANAKLSDFADENEEIKDAKLLDFADENEKTKDAK